MRIDTRRGFLKSAIGAAGFANATAARRDYKALVCLFLRGGNDGSNMVIPVATSVQNYETYKEVRGSLSLPRGSLLPIETQSGDVYGLHPRLTALQSLFRRGRAAIMANVGVISARAGNRYSHADQQARWERALPRATHPPMTLEPIVRAIAMNSRRASNREVFCCNLDGFDTHGNQLETQDGLMAKLDRAVATLHSAMERLGTNSQVTLFTASEFGRALRPNSTGGSDHGWGNHQFIIGGACRGGEVYGTFPSLECSAMTPTTGVDQYSTDLAHWLVRKSSDTL
ncbi:MAG: DUF1501 domain-containing protein [Acidobacteriia bacterium]|nr:DUF1501 domain-containing protein [Terriglobia bacterium]